MAAPHSRRSFLTAAAAVGATFGVPAPGFGQTFPDKSKQIRGIVAFAVSSTSDTLARAYAHGMTDALGTTVFIENRPGAEGVLGLQAAKIAPADGYTILFTSLSTQVVSPHLFKKLPYEPLSDFIPLAGTMKTALCMSVGPSITFKSAREFFEAAKASPGKYSFASVSATTRLTGEMVAKAAGIKLLNVPYKSFSDLMSDLISGRVDMLFIDPPSLLPYLKQGVRVLAAATAKRLPALPEVPTFEEQGLPGLEILGWHAAFAPARTPTAAVVVLRDAVRQASRSKYVTEYFSKFGMEPLDLAGDELAAFQRAEYEKWGRAVREAGLAGSM